MPDEERYKRNLPHIQPMGETFFVTYNLAGSLPRKILESHRAAYEAEKSKIYGDVEKDAAMIKLRKRYFKRQDDFLNKTIEGPHYLKVDGIAEKVAQSLFYWDNKKLELICYCIMSNHVHVVLRLFGKNEIAIPAYLQKVMQSIKEYSARQGNIILKRKGQFWQRESFDYLVRGRDELYRIIEYVLDNPIKAGLCLNRKDWKWSYINPDYNEFM